MTARHALTSLEREGWLNGGARAELLSRLLKSISQTDELPPSRLASRGLVAASQLLCNKIID